MKNDVEKGYVKFHWRTSPYFTMELLKCNFGGEVCLDILNGVIYLHVAQL